MNFAPYVHLCWKEYRSIRLFWIAVVALVVLLQWIGSAVSIGNLRLGGLDFNLALAFPALFAVGCAGTAFAGEREEGTYDFLCAAPVLPRQIFVSKLVVPVLAIIVMYGVLWCISLLHTHGELPAGNILENIAGLWIVAALEGIAWGMLFSILMSRPLLAVILAIAAGSTIVNVMAWLAAPAPNHTLALGDYSRVLPWRLLTAALVMAIDIYLGLHWLHRGSGRKQAPARAASSESLPLRSATETTESIAYELKKKPDRSSIVVCLFWQQWRQSKWLMLLMAVLDIAVCTMVCLSKTAQQLVSGMNPARYGYSHGDILVSMAAMASLMGSFVFLADQERRNFRFFVEHNVPTRCVWLSRQLPWIVALFMSTFIVCHAWLVSEGSLVQLLTAVRLSLQRWGSYTEYPSWILSLPPLGYAFLIVAVSYAAGQWVSMFVRSGILSGFFGLLLTGLLCCWVLLISILHIPWWWSVAPIPLVLLCATWLRAPDWISENSTWLARLRAGAVVLIPAIALLAGVPIYRVQSIPKVDPGFNPAEYLAGITPEALRTGELYRDAYRSYNFRKSAIEDSVVDEEKLVPHHQDWSNSDDAWLERNDECLDFLLRASRRPTCALEDPATLGQSKDPLSKLREGRVYPPALVSLLVASGRQLETQKKLDEALDRYGAAFQTISHLTAYCTDYVYAYRAGDLARCIKEVLDELAYWAAQPGQTAARIRRAIQMLNALDSSILHLEDGIKSEGATRIPRMLAGGFTRSCGACWREDERVGLGG